MRYSGVMILIYDEYINSHFEKIIMNNLSMLGLFLLIFSFNVMAQSDSFNRPVISQTDGIAINGYDAVAFFKENKAIQGSDVYSCRWNDATWYFSSEENRDLFLKNPTEYAPQYGGYCAHAVASNKFIESDPKSFSIKDKKLYLYRNNKSKKKALFNFTKIKSRSDKNWLTFTSTF